ncbi:MAG: hypothetical protein M9884_05640 [Rhodocyclaceae bacterium]|nr:hypothetical protein [Rhodocyclaceae bacterium]
MLENFQLAVIIGRGAKTQLLRVPLHQALQDSLAVSWQEQFDAFIAVAHEIDFDPGYLPESDERFRLKDYVLPDWLKDENSQTIQNLDSIGEHEELMESIKGVVGFARDDHGDEVILFQNFSRSHVISPGRFLFLQNNTYKSTSSTGLTLDHKLGALFRTNQSVLLFHNFRMTNSFLPLADYFEEASEQEIRAVLDHELLVPEDPDALAVDAPQWFRKRFAMLKNSGILDEYTAQQIADHSAGYEVAVQLNGDRIIFPADKAAAKRLLQFLNEELFRGAITETLYETNSKREAD